MTPSLPPPNTTIYRMDAHTNYPLSDLREVPARAVGVEGE